MEKKLIEVISNPAGLDRLKAGMKDYEKSVAELKSILAEGVAEGKSLPARMEFISKLHATRNFPLDVVNALADLVEVPPFTQEELAQMAEYDAMDQEQISDHAAKLEVMAVLMSARNDILNPQEKAIAQLAQMLGVSPAQMKVMAAG